MSDILDTASFDQFTDFKTVDEIINTKSRIIFSSEAYVHFLRLINESNIRYCYCCNIDIYKYGIFIK